MPAGRLFGLKKKHRKKQQVRMVQSRQLCTCGRYRASAECACERARAFVAALSRRYFAYASSYSFFLSLQRVMSRAGAAAPRGVTVYAGGLRALPLSLSHIYVHV